MNQFTASTKIISNTHDKAIKEDKKWASGAFENPDVVFNVVPSRFGITRKVFDNGDVAFSIGVRLSEADQEGMGFVVKACEDATPQGWRFKSVTSGDYLYLSCKLDETGDKFAFDSNITKLTPKHLTPSTKNKELKVTGELYLCYNMEGKTTKLVVKVERLDFK